jgi:hypothetical protein
MMKKRRRWRVYPKTVQSDNPLFDTNPEGPELKGEHKRY